MKQLFHKLTQLVVILLAIGISADASDKIEIILGEDRGESNYYVHNTDLSNFLESKLVFPIQSDWIGIEYQKSFDDFTITMGTITQMNNEQKTKNGEDYDWQNTVPTIYSFSNNYVTKNQTLYLEISKKIDIDIINNLSLKMSLKNLDFKWKNTYQEDYTHGTSVFIQGDTLTYSQEIKKIGFSLFSNKSDSDFLYEGWINYYDIDSTDHHLLRNLMTTMNNKGLGYEVNLGYKYKIFSDANIKFLLTYEVFENESQMKFYSNGLYAGSYPSRVEYTVFAPSLIFEYKF